MREWLSGDFDTSTGLLSGAEGAVQILLPIAAVAIGMTVFGLLLYLTEHGIV